MPQPIETAPLVAVLRRRHDPHNGGWSYYVFSTTAKDANAESMRHCHMGWTRPDAEDACEEWNTRRAEFGFPPLAFRFDR